MLSLKARGWITGGFRDSQDRDVFDRLYDIFQISKGHFVTVNETEPSKLGRYAMAMTLEEVGKQLGISSGRAQQIEARALRKLRHPSRSRELREFLN